MLEHLARFSLDTREWGRVLILRPVPLQGDIWGDLAPLRETPWGRLLPVVQGDVFSDALHGHATPLMRQIGPHPHGLLKQVPEKYRTCMMKLDCMLYDPVVCFPCKDVPECYSPPGLETPEARLAANAVVIAWKEGRYVVLVEGDEFSLG